MREVDEKLKGRNLPHMGINSVQIISMPDNIDNCHVNRANLLALKVSTCSAN